MKSRVLLDEHENDVMLEFQTKTVIIKTQNKTMSLGEWYSIPPDKFHQAEGALEACDSRAVQQFYDVFSFDLFPISVSKNTPSTQVDLIGMMGINLPPNEDRLLHSSISRGSYATNMRNTLELPPTHMSIQHFRFKNILKGSRYSLIRFRLPEFW